MLKAGCATTEITPALGTLMAAFPKQGQGQRTSTGVHDALQARTVILEQGEELLACCSIDLCGIRPISVQRIRQQVHSAVPQLAEERIMLMLSHTHAGAELNFNFGATPDDRHVLEIEHKIGACIISAAQKTRETVSISAERIDCPCNHNRRVRNQQGEMTLQLEYDAELCGGPCDSDLHVVKLQRRDGSCLAVLFHYTAHALCFGRDNDQFSADYPGFAARRIEDALPGCTALFTQGAAGNIHPHHCMRADDSAVNETGSIIADHALAACGNARVSSDDTLAFDEQTLHFDNRMDPALQVAVQIAVLRLGPMLFAIVPGEFFVEFQLQFKAAIDHPFVSMIAYSNGWPGYIAPKEIYPEGGYGVDQHTGDPARYSRTSLPPGSGETIMQQLIQMSQDLLHKQASKEVSTA